MGARRQILQSELVQLFRSSGVKPITPAHLCILTDSALILLTDDDSQTWLHGQPHGAIWRYIPLRQISSSSLAIRDDLLSLCLELPGELRLESLYDATKKHDLERLQRRLHSCTS